MPEHVVTVTYTEDLVRIAAKEYWQQTIAKNGFFYLALLIALFFGWMLLGLPQWFLGFTGGAVLIWAGVVIGSYFRIKKFSMARFVEMGNKTATFHFSEDGIRAESDVAKTEMRWKMIDKIIQQKQVWLFSIAKSSYFTLPIASVPDETKQFILDHVPAK